ncbi:MAG: tetratricopeptide repeat protein [Alphaproteobacteria bacterium]
MADIFREVDEDLRRESAEKLWRKYGTFIIAAAVALVLATAGWVGWREWSESRLAADGLRFAEAVESARTGQADAASDTLTTIADRGAGDYPLLARLRLAALRADAGDAAGAIALYRSVADDGSARAPYRDLAIVMLAMHGLDSEDPQALLARLQPLLAASHMRFSAMEMTALLHHRAGDDAQALEVLTRLLDAGAAVPEPMRDRAQRLRRILGGEAQGTVAG